MKNFKMRLLAASCIGLLSASASYADVTVNGSVISSAIIDQMAKDATRRGQPDTPELRKNITNMLIEREVMTQEAKRKGLDQNPDIKAQMAIVSQNVLIQAFAQDYAKSHPVGDDKVKAAYDQIKAQLGDKEYHVGHVLVASEQEAKGIIAQLKKSGGKDFAKLAKEKSQDAGSKPQGGDLGWTVPAKMVEPFAVAMAKLGKGQYTTEPVQTPYGWHVIMVSDIRPFKMPPLEAVKEKLRQDLEQQEIQKAVAELKSQAKIEGMPTGK